MKVPSPYFIREWLLWLRLSLLRKSVGVLLAEIKKAEKFKDNPIKLEKFANKAEKRRQHLLQVQKVWNSDWKTYTQVRYHRDPATVQNFIPVTPITARGIIEKYEQRIFELLHNPGGSESKIEEPTRVDVHIYKED